MFYHKKGHESDTFIENHNLLVIDTSNSTKKQKTKMVSRSPFCLAVGGLLLLRGSSGDESEFPFSGL